MLAALPLPQRFLNVCFFFPFASFPPLLFFTQLASGAASHDGRRGRPLLSLSAQSEMLFSRERCRNACLARASSRRRPPICHGGEDGVAEVELGPLVGPGLFGRRRVQHLLGQRPDTPARGSRLQNAMLLFCTPLDSRVKSHERMLPASRSNVSNDGGCGGLAVLACRPARIVSGRS